ncbi:hypothetical protein LOK49_LG06G02774 [Camellia lanceoleosa]|uniref:Uncharacterized protein n=1 Tax=Camellia lanceoleosa TaxID=1840588 RepID=A0ACC0H8V1_9ERIC|nr:hypothetical protein LOK49_LG06G02774 [Camellia lanceoleosa]
MWSDILSAAEFNAVELICLADVCSVGLTKWLVCSALLDYSVDVGLCCDAVMKLGVWENKKEIIARGRKDKGRDDKPGVAIQDKLRRESPGDESKDFTTEEAELVLEKADVLEDVSDVSDSAVCLPEILQPDLEDRDTSPVNGDIDTSEVHPPTEAASSSGVSGLSAVQNGAIERNGPSIADDSSSTCSTDSVPSVVMNGPYKGNFLNQKSQKSPSRGRIQRGRATSDATGSANEAHSQPSEVTRDAAQLNGASGSWHSHHSFRSRRSYFSAKRTEHQRSVRYGRTFKSCLPLSFSPSTAGDEEPPLRLRSAVIVDAAAGKELLGDEEPPLCCC